MKLETTSEQRVIPSFFLRWTEKFLRIFYVKRRNSFVFLRWTEKFLRFFYVKREYSFVFFTLNEKIPSYFFTLNVRNANKSNAHETHTTLKSLRDLTPNGFPFGVKSFGKMCLNSKFGLFQHDTEFHLSERIIIFLMNKLIKLSHAMHEAPRIKRS